MVKSRTLRFPGVPRLKYYPGKQKGRPEAAMVSPEGEYQRIADVPALVTASGLPALITGVD